jgi:hypothetical protein
MDTQFRRDTRRWLVVCAGWPRLKRSTCNVSFVCPPRVLLPARAQLPLEGALATPGITEPCFGSLLTSLHCQEDRETNTCGLRSKGLPGPTRHHMHIPSPFTSSHESCTQVCVATCASLGANPRERTLAWQPCHTACRVEARSLFSLSAQSRHSPRPPHATLTNSYPPTPSCEPR